MRAEGAPPMNRHQGFPMTRATHDEPPAAGTWRRLRAWILIALVSAASAAGCVSTREATLHKTARDGLERIGSTHATCPCAAQVVGRYGLTAAARHDPEGAVRLLEARFQAAPAFEADAATALAELSYRAGLEHDRHNPAVAARHYRDAAAAAVLALGAPDQGGCPHAIAVHDRAVSRLLRLARADALETGAHWTGFLSRAGVAVAASSRFVDPSRFTEIDLNDDLRVTGMRSTFRYPGLGVPVTGTRPVDRDHPTEPSEAFFPTRLRVGATVVAAAGGGIGGGAWRLAPLTLGFHDPFEHRCVQVGPRVLPMATDTTTPLAVQASSRTLSLQTFAGLFSSSFQAEVEPGLYMLRPWQPGKVPLVLVHGLNSNPAAFAQVINELRNDPAVTARYQFLLFAYPTGPPIPSSALLLRRALYEAEAAFGNDPAFHRMVLAGHSMGGVLTRMMVTDSGTALWDAVFSVPHGQLQASPRTLEKLTEALIYKPVPFVRRAVFIATPHRGSRISEEPLGRIVSSFIRPSSEQTAWIEEVRRLNGPDAIRADVFRRRSINSIGSLSVRSPVLISTADLPIAPGVAYHSIAYEFAGMMPTDLVVPEWSSRVEGADSDFVTRGIHTSSQNPSTVAELKRILLLHLEDPATR